MKHRAIFTSILTLLTFSYVPHTQAAPPIPDPLKPWVEWVAPATPEESCVSVGEHLQCLWPASLSLDVTAKGGSFSMVVTTQAQSPVTLPGGKDAWPLNVRVNSGRGESAVPVASTDAGPQIFLDSGSHTISGEFSWDQPPEELMIPTDVGLLRIRENGVEKTGLTRLKDGMLSLREIIGGQSEKTTNSLVITVFRKISDGIPFTVRTRLLISAAQERSQLILSDPSPEHTRLTDVQSDLPFYTSGKDLTFGISGGSHWIEFLSVGATPLSEIKVSPPPAPWPVDETWLWEENRDIRVASLQGGIPIDPSLVGVPTHWQGIPTFRVSQGTSVSVQQQAPTSVKQPESAITLQRTLVKDVRGTGFTIADEIVGTLGGSGRLDLRAPAELGYVAFDGNAELVTLAPQTQERGVEVRSQTFNVQATSRLPWDGSTIPAVGWNRDVDWLKISVLSPPGQELLWAKGADNSVGTRFSTWKLSTVFVTLLISIVTGVVLGIFPGIAAGVCFALIHGDNTSLMEVFFLAVLAVPILRRESTDKRWPLAYCLLLLFLTFNTYQYTITDSFERLFPDVTAVDYTTHDTTAYESSSSARSSSSISYNDDRTSNATNALLTYAEGSFGALIMAAAMLIALLFLIQGKFRLASVALGIALGSFMLRSLTATFFDDASISFGTQIEAYNSIANERGLMLKDKMQTIVEELAPADGVASSPPPAASPSEGGQFTVQTGPGMPRWNGRQALLTWNGAVPKDLIITLWYLPRWLGILLSFVKALLMGYLILTLWRAIPATARAWIMGFARMLACVGAFALLPCAVASAQEVFPPTSLLDQLQKKISEERNRAEERKRAQPCESQCVSTETARIVISGRSLVLRSLVHSVGKNAWALPSSSQGSLFTSVFVDGKPVEAARQSEGLTYLLLPNGVHSVEARGTTPNSDIISLSFQQSVGRLDFETPDFQTFVDRDQKTPVAQLMRKASGTLAATGEARTPRVEPWFFVERHLYLTHEGRTSTSVTRVGSVEQEEALSLKLLPTEQVTQGGQKREGDTILVSLKPQESSTSYDGVINLQGGSLNLEASGGDRYSEAWIVSCSAQWRCQFDGWQPTEVFQDGVVTQVFRPRPGDKSVLRFVRPVGAQGSTQSIIKLKHDLEPSTHFLKAHTTIVIRAGQGGVKGFQVPESATVRGFWIDDQDSAALLNTSSRPLELPILKGTHEYKILWQIPQELSWSPHLPQIQTEAPFTNGSFQYAIPQGWIALWTSSSEFGPRVTFWMTLSAALLGFVALSYFITLPCSRIVGILLFSGAWYLHVRAGVYIGAWLYACGIILFLARDSETVIQKRCFSKRYKWAHYAILFAPLAFTGLWLQRAFEVGPDLGLRGVGTTTRKISWYFDRGTDFLPTPNLLVVPPLVWQISLLLWAIFAAIFVFQIARRVLTALGKRHSESGETQT
jgi:hypothetical protein